MSTGGDPLRCFDITSSPPFCSADTMWDNGQSACDQFKLLHKSIRLDGGTTILKLATLIKALSCIRLLEEKGVTVTSIVISASLSLSIKVLELREVSIDTEKHICSEEDGRHVPREELKRAEALVLQHTADLLHQADGSAYCKKWLPVLETEDVALLCVEAMTELDCTTDTLQRLVHEKGGTGSSIIASELIEELYCRCNSGHDNTVTHYWGRC